MTHAHSHAHAESLSCAIITVSDTRTADTDESGKAIAAMLVDEKHRIVSQVIVKDEAQELQRAIQGATEKRADAIILTGGTGISRRDVTYETVRKLLERELPGFGELFRVLSYEEIGSAAMLSRASAGVIGGTILFALPGSMKAVRLGMKKLILPELQHLIGEVRK